MSTSSVSPGARMRSNARCSLALGAGLLLCASLLACGPSIEGVEPDKLPAGAGGTILVRGSGLDSTQLRLEAASIEVTLAPASDQTGADDEGIFVTVPATTPPATYDVVASSGGSETRLEDAFTVTAQRLKMVFIDVGQGDATLIVGTDGTVVLVDGGPFDSKNTLQAALDLHAEGRLDHVVVTHFDADHLAGVVELLGGADGMAGTADDLTPIIWSPDDDGTCDSQTCDRFRTLSAYERRETPAWNTELPLGEAKATVLAVDGRTSAMGPVMGLDDNGRSLVLEVRFEGRRALILGDLTGGGLGTADVEGPLSAATGPVDVLRTAHHGSATSSSEVAMARWAPRLSIFSFGTDNAYCHPEQDTLERVANRSTKVVATGSGTVEDGSRCGGVTDVPANASFGMGNMVLEVETGGGLLLDGEVLD